MVISKRVAFFPLAIKIIAFCACIYFSGCGASRPKAVPLPTYLTDIDTTFVIPDSPQQSMDLTSGESIQRKTVLPKNISTETNRMTSFPETVILENQFSHQDRLSASIGDFVLKIATSLSAQKLMYNPKPAALKDCSGIFHRVLNQLREMNSEWKFPPIASARSSKTIAGWYEKRGEFIPIHDPINQSHLLEPGTVLFFGSKRPASKGMAFKDIQKTIQHLGIAVVTEKDRKNETNRYHLFHGRSRGKPAAITQWHLRDNNPPFGNGRQHWVGYARLVKAPEKMLLTITPEMRQLQKALATHLPQFDLLSCFRFTYIF